jgi:high-affinity nickel-transport protein
VLIVGCAIIVLKIRVPVRLGLAMEFGVALVLIALGLPAAAAMTRNLRARFWRSAIESNHTIHVHSHAHSHDGGFHRHPHAHQADADAVHHDHRFNYDPATPAGRSALKSFGVGLIHGLAGSAAIALIVLGAIPQPLWATAYLTVFCLGTIAGMVLITTAIGAPMVLAAQRVARLHRGLVLSSGLLSLGFGLFIAYQIGIVDGLFSSAPIWTPH